MFLAEIQFGPFAIEYPEILIPVLIGFALFAFCVYRMPPDIPLGIPFLRNTLQTRATRIAEDDAQVKRAEEDIRRVHDDYAARLHRIEEEARERIDAAVREADNARIEIIDEAKKSAQALRRRTEEEISRERTRQRILLRKQIVQTALDAAEDAIQTHSTDAVHRQLIQDFISLAGNDGNAVAMSAAPVASRPDAATLIPTSQEGA